MKSKIPKADPKTAVKKLITKLKVMYYNQDPMLDGIDNFQNLYSALCDLDDIVGMYDIKKSIVDQIKFLLVNYTGGKSKFEGSMLNTMLCGNPGTGKTSVGICLSNIWNALGLLKKENIKENINEKSEKSYAYGLKPFNKGRRNAITVKLAESKDGENTNDKNNYDDLFLMALIGLMSERKKEDNNDVESDNKSYKEFKSYKDHKDHKDHKKPEQSLIKYTKPVVELNENYNTNSETNLGDLLRHRKYTTVGLNNIKKHIDTNKVNSFKKLERVKFNDNSIKIVSRVDLVAGYVGQSSPKTRDVLMDALKEGKVVFIDEAYSIVLDDKDPFGSEVLTEINRFMSEHPSLVCIFAGYKDKMESTIFKAQPGLKRRLTWIFEIKKYTGDMLTSIYLKQLEKDGWKYDGDTKILDNFFGSNIDHFSAFGGDTLTMCFYSKLVYSELKFDYCSYKSLSDKTITNEIFMKAYDDMYCITRPKIEPNMSHLSMFC